MYPFRFLAAYNAIKDHTNSNKKKFMKALEESINISVDNMPLLPGSTAVLIDISQSMTQSPISTLSDIYPKDIACLFGAMTERICQYSHLFRFSSSAEYIAFKKKIGILDAANEIGDAELGGGTVTSNTIRILIDRKEKVDRIITFTDAIGFEKNPYDPTLAEMIVKYRKLINPKCRYYEVDLMGYGNTQVPDTDPLTCLISGWSEKIFEYIPLHESIGKVTYRTY